MTKVLISMTMTAMIAFGALGMNSVAYAGSELATSVAEAETEARWTRIKTIGLKFQKAVDTTEERTNDRDARMAVAQKRFFRGMKMMSK